MLVSGSGSLISCALRDRLPEDIGHWDFYRHVITVLQIVKLLARLPLPYRRRALRVLWRAALPFRSNVGFGLEKAIEHYLKVGTRASHRIAREHDYHDLLLVMEWHASIQRSPAQLRSDLILTRENDPTLMARVAASGDTVILAPMHMGIFPTGITYVLGKYLAGRRLLVLRARDDLEQNNTAMDRLREIASEFRILNTRNEAEFVDAMRFVRKGGVVISLLDLPETYGSPVNTTLFGDPAAIALGLDAMARLLKAVVVPMTVNSLQSRDEIVFGQPFEVSDMRPEDRQSLAHAIGRQIEQFVKIAPPQWHMWTRILEFYPERLRLRTPQTAPLNGMVDAHVDV